MILKPELIPKFILLLKLRFKFEDIIYHTTINKIVITTINVTSLAAIHINSKTGRINTTRMGTKRELIEQLVEKLNVSDKDP